MKKGFKSKVGVAALAMGVGIIIMSVGFAMGGLKRASASDGTVIIKDTVTGVTSLRFDIPYGQVSVKKGSEYKLEISKGYEDEFTSKVSDGVWKVDYDKGKSGFNLFGMNITLPFSKNGFSYSGPTVIITIPEDAVFDKTDISIGAGVLNADYINTNYAKLEVGAGEMKITGFAVKQRMKVDAGTGSISIKDAVVREADINCGVGEVYFAGEILDSCKADCGIGLIRMELKNKEEECNYSIDSGIGNVIINDRSYRGYELRINNDKLTSFKLNCGIGEIRIYNEHRVDTTTTIIENE